MLEISSLLVLVQVCSDQPLPKYKCIFCAKAFTTKRGKITHLNSCHGNPKNIS